MVTFGIFPTVFEIWMFKAGKWLVYSTLPCLMPPLTGNPLEFLDETYPAKTRGMGLPCGENFVP